MTISRTFKFIDVLEEYEKCKEDTLQSFLIQKIYNFNVPTNIDPGQLSLLVEVSSDDFMNAEITLTMRDDCKTNSFLLIYSLIQDIDSILKDNKIHREEQLFDIKSNSEKEELFVLPIANKFIKSLEVSRSKLSEVLEELNKISVTMPASVAQMFNM